MENKTLKVGMIVDDTRAMECRCEVLIVGLAISKVHVHKGYRSGEDRFVLNKYLEEALVPGERRR